MREKVEALHDINKPEMSSSRKMLSFASFLPRAKSNLHTFKRFLPVTFICRETANIVTHIPHHPRSLLAQKTVERNMMLSVFTNQ